MPGFNGKGPKGEGPMTGGARGKCAGNKTKRSENQTGRGMGPGGGRGRNIGGGVVRLDDNEDNEVQVESSNTDNSNEQEYLERYVKETEDRLAEAKEELKRITSSKKNKSKVK